MLEDINPDLTTGSYLVEGKIVIISSKIGIC